MKVLTMTKEVAELMAKSLHKRYYISSCDVLDLEEGTTVEARRILDTAMGETQCFRTDDGDIVAWWE